MALLDQGTGKPGDARKREGEASSEGGAARPADRNAVRPADRTARPAERVAAKPADKATGTTARPADRSSGTTARPADKATASTARPADRSTGATGRPADKNAATAATARAADKSAATGATPAARPTDKNAATTGSAAERAAAAKTVARNLDKAVDPLVARARLESIAKGRPQGLKLPLVTRLRNKLPSFGGGVTEKDLVLFTRQFATMVGSGLPLIQCLAVQCNQAENPVMRAHLTQVKRYVEKGGTLAEGLRKHPRTFDTMYVSLVQAGEVGGIMDTILNRLAIYIEKSAKLKKQIKIAMVYPTAISIVAFVVVSLLVLKVVPVFEKMFSGFGQALPPQTQLAIDISRFFQDHFILMAGALIGTVLWVSSFYRTDRGRLVLDRLLIRLPVFGDIVTKVAVARFCRTMSTMLSSGVPILGAMEVCAKTAGNKVVENTVIAARQAVSEGKTIAGPLQRSKVFPDMVCQMISVGETTGALDNMLGKIADFYDDEVESAVSAMASLIEPALMVFLGVIIGGLLIAMYMPIFSMSSAVGGGS